MSGAPELGKSHIQLAYAASVTRGTPWPDGSPGPSPQRVILVTAEDQIGDTVKPRALAAGVDCSKLIELQAIKRDGQETMFLLSTGLAALERLILDLGDVG